MAADNFELGKVSETDKSLGMLNDLFGTGFQNILNGQESSGGASGVFFTMLHALSTIVLAAVVLLMGYTVFMGVIGTAHQGEALGKRYSTLFTPLRVVIAVALLLPLPWSQLTLIEAAMLKAIYYSVSAANYMEEKAVDYITQHGGVTTPTHAPLPTGTALAQEILKNLVVQEYYREREDTDSSPGVEETSTDGIKSFVFTPPGNNLAIYPFMGRIKVTCAAENTNICNSEYNLAIKLANDLRPIAKAIVSQWSGGQNTPLDNSQITNFNNAVNNYQNDSKNIVDQAISSLQSNDNLQQLGTQIKENGWAWLGAYYPKITAYNEKALANAKVKAIISNQINTDGARFFAGKEIDSVLERYSVFMGRVGNEKIAKQQLLINSSNSSPATAILGSFFNDALLSSLPYTEKTASSGAATVFATTIATGDPIVNLEILGHQIENMGSIMLTAGLGVAGLAAGGDLIKDIANPTGSILTKLTTSQNSSNSSSILGKIASGLTAILIPVGFFLVLAGAFLAYYLPALPFIYWASTYIGWFILCVEMLIAAPVWAGMHAIPEGDGLVNQNASSGYPLFFAIIARPALNVIGFFLAIILMTIIGNFIGDVYLDFVLNSEKDNKTVGPIADMFGWLGVMFVGSAVMVVCTHKALSLISWLADNVLRWSGNNSPSLNEGQDEHKANVLYGAIFNTTKEGIGKGSGAIVSTIKKNNKQSAIDKNALSQGDS